MVGDDIIVEDLAKRVIGDVPLRAVVRVRRRVADKDVDLSPFGARVVGEALEFVFRPDALRVGRAILTLFSVVVSVTEAA